MHIYIIIILSIVLPFISNTMIFFKFFKIRRIIYIYIGVGMKHIIFVLHEKRERLFF